MPCRAESIGYALALAVAVAVDVAIAVAVAVAIAVAVAVALVGLDAKRTYTAAGELGVVALTGLDHLPSSDDLNQSVFGGQEASGRKGDDEGCLWRC